MGGAAKSHCKEACIQGWEGTVGNLSQWFYSFTHLVANVSKLELHISLLWENHLAYLTHLYFLPGLLHLSL